MSSPRPSSVGIDRVSGTTAITIKHYGVQFRETSTITSWTVVDGTGVSHNMLTWFNLTSDVTEIGTDDAAMIIPHAWRSGSQSFKLKTGSANLLRG